MSRSTWPNLANRMSEHRSAFALQKHALAALAGVALSAAQGSTRAPVLTDAAFSAFFHARTAQEASAASHQIVASGGGFHQAFGRLRQGRVYSRDVLPGVV